LFGKLPHEIGALPYRYYRRAKDYYFIATQGSEDDDIEEFVSGSSVPVEVKF
jgi:hypothetical protein